MSFDTSFILLVKGTISYGSWYTNERIRTYSNNFSFVTNLQNRFETGCYRYNCNNVWFKNIKNYTCLISQLLRKGKIYFR